MYMLSGRRGDTCEGGVVMFTKSLALELTPHGSSITEAEQQAAMDDFVQCSVPLR